VHDDGVARVEHLDPLGARLRGRADPAHELAEAVDPVAFAAVWQLRRLADQNVVGQHADGLAEAPCLDETVELADGVRTGR